MELNLGPGVPGMIARTELFGALPAFALVLLSAGTVLVRAQATGPQAQQPAAESSTSTDFFIMPGSDLDRPGLLPRANLNIGIGHTFGFLKKDPIGDDFGSHTEALGIMKNFGLPSTKVASGYTWVQAGLTSFTGTPHVENRLYSGEALGLVIHFNDHNAIWIQETYNKIPTVPWYTTSGIGYTWSW